MRIRIMVTAVHPGVLTKDRLLAALKERVSGLKPDEIREACGHVQTNEEL